MLIGLSTGRVATRYLVQCLKASGFDVGLEKLADGGGIGWPMLSHCQAGQCAGANVFLIYRPALDCLGSFHYFSAALWRRGVPEYYSDISLGHSIDLRLFMRYWLYINSRSLEYADTVLSFNLLKSEKGKKALESCFGRPIAWDAVSPSRYRFQHPQYSIEDLYSTDEKLADQILQLEYDLSTY